MLNFCEQDVTWSFCRALPLESTDCSRNCKTHIRYTTVCIFVLANLKLTSKQKLWLVDSSAALTQAADYRKIK